MLEWISDMNKKESKYFKYFFINNNIADLQKNILEWIINKIIRNIQNTFTISLTK